MTSQNPDPTLRRYRFLLILFAVVVLASGLGLRDPWPPDEPRFSLVAREMVASGQWLFPTRGGELYPDKPPVFMWSQAAMMATGMSERVAFLLPSLLAGFGMLWLLFDLSRRLWDERTGLLAAALLLISPQFILQAKTGQIDGLLAFWTTLGLYGFIRYFCLDHRARWFYLGFACAGLGVITKGVGIILLLLFLPWLWLWYDAKRSAPKDGFSQTAPWFKGFLVMLATISVWLLPMLIVVAQSDNPALLAYQDNILFKQTGERYAAAWHHIKPFWFFWIEVIPIFWLPVALLLPGLVPRWYEAFKQRRPEILLPLFWALLVVLFFSFSPGKRAQYILPALPALCLAAAPYLRELVCARWVRISSLGLTLFFSLLLAGLFVWAQWVDPKIAFDYEAKHGLNPLPLLGIFATLGLLGALIFRAKRGQFALIWFLGSIWVALAVVAYPQFNDVRSSRGFIAKVRQQIGDDQHELGLVMWVEQLLLQAGPDTAVFGFGTAPNEQAESAAQWLSEAPARRHLLIQAPAMEGCFDKTLAADMGKRHRRHWYLVGDNARIGRCDN